MAPDAATLAHWNGQVTTALGRGWEYRLLLGLALAASRPRHGDVTAWQDAVASELGRSPRWIRETTRVAAKVELALDQGVDLPLALREVSWSAVPAAIENHRAGRPMDHVPARKSAPQPSSADQVAALADKLRSVLLEIEAPADRRAAVAAVRAMLDEVSPPSGPGGPPDRGHRPPGAPRGPQAGPPPHRPPRPPPRRR